MSEWRYYGDFAAWWEQPRDYASLRLNFFLIHRQAMPAELGHEIVQLERDRRER